MEVCFLRQWVTRALTPQLVGTIGSLTSPLVDKRPSDITPPTPVLTPSEIQHEAASRISLPEPRPSSPPGYPHSFSGGTREVTSDAGDTIIESNALAYDNPTLDRFHVEDQSSNMTLDQKYDFHGEEVKRYSDPGAGDEEMTRLPEEGELTEVTRGACQYHCRYISANVHQFRRETGRTPRLGLPSF